MEKYQLRVEQPLRVPYNNNGMEPGTVVAERYVIEALAGIGGMSAVFKARDLDGSAVALKVLQLRAEHLDARFAREITLLGRLHHSNIVEYRDSGYTSTGQRFLAMEWLEGTDLDNHLKQSAMRIDEALVLVERIAAALGSAHAQGVVHRDVKPHNIFLPGGDVHRAKLLDFGIAHWDDAGQILTQPGMPFGTPAYMAPEQARGDLHIDQRADVFSLGCVLFECLTGRPAFAACNSMAVLSKILFEDPLGGTNAAFDLPAPIEALLRRMLAKTPAERPRDGNEVVSEIAALDKQALRVFLRLPDTPHTDHGITGAEQRLVSVLMARLSQRPSAGRGLPLSSSLSRGPRVVELDWPGNALALQYMPTDLAPPASPALLAHADSMAGNHTAQTRILTPQSADDDAEPAECARNTELVEELRRRCEGLGVRLGVLRDGSLIAVLDNHHTPLYKTAGDQAVAMARCAFAVRREFPQATVAIATGRAEVNGRRLIGSVIDQAAHMLAALGKQEATTGIRADAIRIDELTARLVQGRFAVEQAEPGTPAHPAIYDLHGAPAGLVRRRLLGKATPFVGRRQELNVLLNALDECIDEEQARAIVVSGPPGVGKSRLCAEFLRRLDERDDSIEVWLAQGDLLHTGSPLSLLADALRFAIASVDGEPVAEPLSKLRTYIGNRIASTRDAERVIAFVGGLLGIAPGTDEQDVQLRAARMDRQLMGDQLRRACCDLIEAALSSTPRASTHDAASRDRAGATRATRSRPLVLVLDDVHWGDRATIEVLDLALRKLADRPLLILALGRPELADAFPRLWSKHNVIELGLGRISRRAAEQFVRASLGEDIDRDRMSALIEHADGNPFYLEELVRSTAAGQITLPETVLAMIHARLLTLEPQARRVLRAASVFGSTFWREGVSAVLGIAGTGDQTEAAESEVNRWLDVLVHSELIARVPTSKLPGHTEYKLVHALIQEGAYGMLTDSDRRLGHCLAAEWLEQAGETDARVIAEHFDRGEAPDRALPFYVCAAEAALDRSDFATALALAERGIRCGAGGEILGALRRIQAEEQIWRGNPTEVARLCAQAMELLPGTSRAWYHMAGELAIARGKLCQTEALEALAEELRHRPDSQDDRTGRLIATAKLVQQLFVVGLGNQAEALFAAIETELAELGEADPLAAAEVHLARAVRAEVLQSDCGLVLQELELCAARFEEVGHLRQVCLHRNNVGYAKTQLGLYAEAQADLRAALAIAERLELDYVAHGVRGHLAEVFAHDGSLEAAELLARQACDWFADHGDSRMEALFRLCLATVLIQARDLGRAEHEASAALALLPESVPLRPRALATLARVQLRLDQADQALELASTAMHALDSLGSVESGELLVRLVYAEALDACGDRDGARIAISNARARLLARAAAISQPSWRSSFVDNIHDHAKITQLAQIWST